MVVSIVRLVAFVESLSKGVVMSAKMVVSCVARGKMVLSGSSCAAPFAEISNMAVANILNVSFSIIAKIQFFPYKKIVTRAS